MDNQSPQIGYLNLSGWEVNVSTRFFQNWAPNFKRRRKKHLRSFSHERLESAKFLGSKKKKIYSEIHDNQLRSASKCIIAVPFCFRTAHWEAVSRISSQSHAIGWHHLPLRAVSNESINRTHHLRVDRIEFSETWVGKYIHSQSPESYFQTRGLGFFFGGIVDMWVFRVQVKYFIVSLPRDEILWNVVNTLRL